MSLVAELLALLLRPGDLVALSGPLGAGKSTLCRAIVRAFLDDPEADVPSPTFSLVQTYEGARFDLSHLDFYRLSEGEVVELGIEDLLARGAALIEWPERAPALRERAALTVTLEEDTDDARTVTLSAGPTFTERLDRFAAMIAFIDATANRPTRIRYLQGDASPRAYARLETADGPRILMDSPRRPDGPPVRDGLPYSRIAHLAEDVRPFIAIGHALIEAGLSAPRIYAHDVSHGLLLIEDLGDRTFGAEMQRTTPQPELWAAATDTLSASRRIRVTEPLALPDGTTYRLPTYDHRALAIETELLVDWLWPLVKGEPVDIGTRKVFADIWTDIIQRILVQPSGLVLRDYHSPNLMWLPDRSGIRRVGILDFQDAVVGHPAYDLVSLLQDARVDVPAPLESELVDRYISTVAKSEPSFDPAAFRLAYAALGVQRNTKILGIFARLAVRDGKARYLGHIPRIWGYLERGLSHAAMAPLADWYARHWPVGTRIAPHQPSAAE